MLVVEDKLSMAHSLETRVPFLDNNLVDFAMKIPVNNKIANLKNPINLDENTIGRKKSNYYEKTRDGKLILRKVMESHVPEKVYAALKQGFSADASWFRGESIDFVKDKLFDNKARIYNLVDKKTTRNLLQEHLNGSQNRRLLVWSLLYLETFLAEFFLNICYSNLLDIEMIKSNLILLGSTDLTYSIAKKLKDIVNIVGFM